jgi:hypothetical protein
MAEERPWKRLAVVFASGADRPWWRLGMVFAWVTVATLAVFHGGNAVFGPEYDRTAHVARAVAMFRCLASGWSRSGTACGTC